MQPTDNPTTPQLQGNQVLEQLLRKVSRQLRAIKVALAMLFIFFFLMIAALGYIAYRVVTFTQQVNTKITNIENKASQSLDFKSQICDSSAGTLLKQCQ